MPHLRHVPIRLHRTILYIPWVYRIYRAEPMPPLVENSLAGNDPTCRRAEMLASKLAYAVSPGSNDGK